MSRRTIVVVGVALLVLTALAFVLVAAGDGHGVTKLF